MNYIRVFLMIFLIALGLFAAALALVLIRFSSELTREEESAGRSPFVDACPHCGGRSEFRAFTNYDGEVSYETGAVVCVQCGAQTKEEVTSGCYGIAVSPEAIIQKWNRRCGR